MSARILTNPTNDQVEQLVEIMVTAFNNAPLTIGMTGGDPSLEAALCRSVVKGSVNATIWVIEDEGEIRAFAIWFRPGEFLYKDEAAKEQGWNQYWESLNQQTKDWWKYSGERQGKGRKEFFGEQRNTWHLDMIATDPKYQGRGYGKILMDAGRKQAIEDGTYITFCTQKESNARWYTKLGATKLGEIEIDLAPFGDKFPSMFFKWEV